MCSLVTVAQQRRPVGDAPTQSLSVYKVERISSETPFRFFEVQQTVRSTIRDSQYDEIAARWAAAVSTNQRQGAAGTAATRTQQAGFRPNQHQLPPRLGIAWIKISRNQDECPYYTDLEISDIHEPSPQPRSSTRPIGCDADGGISGCANGDTQPW